MVGSLTELSLSEARSLARVFGEIDRQKSILLLLFIKPDSRWGISLRVDKLPKSYRIPRASLYRKVDELYESSFLDLLGTETGLTGMTVSRYRLSLKGLLAGFIYAYVLFLDSGTPDGVKKNTGLDELIGTFESMPGWKLYVSFLRWHKGRSIDLSQARIDAAYFTFTLILSMLERPKDVSEQDLTRLSDHMKKFGLAPSQEPKDLVQLLEKAKMAFDEFGEWLVIPLTRYATGDSELFSLE